MVVIKNCTEGIDPETLQETLDGVLERVIDRAVGEPLSGTGFVERFRYQPDRCRLIVFCHYRMTRQAACLVVNDTAIGQTADALRMELEALFPRLDIEIVFLPSPRF